MPIPLHDGNIQKLHLFQRRKSILTRLALPSPPNRSPVWRQTRINHFRIWIPTHRTMHKNKVTPFTLFLPLPHLPSSSRGRQKIRKAVSERIQGLLDMLASSLSVFFASPCCPTSIPMFRKKQQRQQRVYKKYRKRCVSESKDYLICSRVRFLYFLYTLCCPLQHFFTKKRRNLQLLFFCRRRCFRDRHAWWRCCWSLWILRRVLGWSYVRLVGRWWW